MCASTHSRSPLPHCAPTFHFHSHIAIDHEWSHPAGIGSSLALTMNKTFSLAICFVSLSPNIIVIANAKWAFSTRQTVFNRPLIRPPNEEILFRRNGTWNESKSPKRNFANKRISVFYHFTVCQARVTYSFFARECFRKPISIRKRLLIGIKCADLVPK